MSAPLVNMVLNHSLIKAFFPMKCQTFILYHAPLSQMAFSVCECECDVCKERDNKTSVERTLVTGLVYVYIW